MPTSASQRRMKNGTLYTVQLCIEPESGHTAANLKTQITDGLDRLSLQSRWQRFASPLKKLSESQLDYLISLDGKEKVAWCAFIHSQGRETGIGLARYVKLKQEAGVAEFAVTVVDEYQGQGIGYELVTHLIESAKVNDIVKLRGYVLHSNKRMLALCRRLGASLDGNDRNYVIAEIAVAAV